MIAYTAEYIEHKKCLNILDMDYKLVEYNFMKIEKVEEPLHPMISASIMTAARKMPKWEPGKKDGKVATVRVTIPIEFHK